jgi:two-component system OmpR family sensor kinase
MKLGRLFWKFFLMFWLAQIVTAIGVGFTFWALHREPPAPPPHAWRYPQGNALPPPPNLPRPLLFPLVPMATGGLVSLIFAWLLALYFARPIRMLHDAFEAETSGKLETRVGNAMGKRRDELSDLGEDFDRMAERLQNLMEGHRRLLHDVSHELRSPLARLQAASDLMLQQPERAAELMGRIQREIGRIDDLVGELLKLSRLDTGVDHLTRETFNLASLIHDVAEDARFEADPKDCAIVLELPWALPVDGDIEWLRRAVENVLRNAVRHSPAGRPIQMRGDRDDGFAHLTIEDQGGGVAPADLEAIFEPFHRAANAKPFEGYGLGLTITRQVLRLHGGSVWAGNLGDGGFAVHMRLPLSPQ